MTKKTWDPIEAALALEIRPVLRKGDNEWGVGLLKRLLGTHGFGYADWADPAQPVSYEFNAGLESRVVEFQRQHGLLADGIVGPASWAALCTDTRDYVPLAKLAAAGAESVRHRVVMVARQAQGQRIREATGHNDGPFVEAILAAVQLKKGNPWCVAAAWCIVALAYRSLDRPAPAWPLTAKRSVTALEAAARSGEGGLSIVAAEDVQPGDLLLIPRTHVGVVVEVISEKVVGTIEGNTNSAGSAEGDGLYAKTRNKAGHVFVRVA